MRLLLLTAALATAISIAATQAEARDSTEAKKAQIRLQLQRFYHADGYIKAIGRVAYRTIYSPNRPVKQQWVRATRWLMRIRADARAKILALRAPSWPTHHALWMCIHGDPNYGSHYGNEASRWDTISSNGHYGGLQMHQGWGYGTSYHASDDSQLVQEQSAERAYKASNWSRGWLSGQWGQTIGPCWRYAS